MLNICNITKYPQVTIQNFDNLQEYKTELKLYLYINMTEINCNHSFEVNIAEFL